jgi:hypothetical protein
LCFYRRINNYTVTDFLTQLSYETWDGIFENKDINLIFNSFLNIYLRIFNASFSKISKYSKAKSGITWITKGIKVSCKRKRELYLMLKNKDDISIKLYCDSYCKILNKVIIAAKKMAYDNYCIKSLDKMKSTWKITNIETEQPTEMTPSI